MWTRLAVMTLKRAGQAALSLVVLISVLWAFVAWAPKAPVVQLDPFFVADAQVNPLQRYLEFWGNLLWGELGTGRGDTDHTPLREAVGQRLLRSLALYGAALLVAAPLGGGLVRRLKSRTSFRLWLVGLNAAFLPALLFVLTWFFSGVLELFPKFGFANPALWRGEGAAPIQNVFTGLSGALALGAVVGALLARAGRLGRSWAVPLAAFGGLLALGAAQGAPAWDLLRFAALPWLSLTIVMGGAYMLFVAGPLGGAFGWPVFVSLSVSAQLYVEASFRWEGLGHAFFRLFVIIVDWPLMFGAAIAVLGWAVLLLFGRALAGDLGWVQRAPASDLIWQPDRKALWVGRGLAMGLGAAAVLASSSLLALQATGRALWVFGLTSLAAAGLAGALGAVAGGALAGLAGALGRWRWAVSGLEGVCGVIMGVPWLGAVPFALYLTLSTFGGYGLYELAAWLGLLAAPAAFFLWRVPSPSPKRRRVVVTTAAGFLLVASLFLLFEPVLRLGGWGSTPNASWGQLVQNGYVAAAFSNGFDGVFWQVSALLWAFAAMGLLLSLELQLRR